MEQELNSSAFFDQQNMCAVEAPRKSLSERRSRGYAERNHPYNAPLHSYGSSLLGNDPHTRCEKIVAEATRSCHLSTPNIGNEKFYHSSKLTACMGVSQQKAYSAPCSGTQENPVSEQPNASNEPLAPNMTQSLDRSTEEDSSDPDNKNESSPPFTLMLPLIIEFDDDRISSFQLDLNLVKEAVSRAAGDIVSVKPTIAGRFVVTVSKTDAAVKLQLMTSLLGAPVNVTLTSWYRTNIAKMHSVPLYMTNQMILQALAPYGVIGVRRSANYIRLTDGSCIEMPKNIILLTFSPEVTELPARLPIDKKMYEIERCASHPVQCSNCFRFLHYAHQCKGPTRCKLCAGKHFYRSCTSFSSPCCVNCKGPHPATYSMCPTKLRLLQASWAAEGIPAPALGSSSSL